MASKRFKVKKQDLIIATFPQPHGRDPGKGRERERGREREHAWETMDGNGHL